MKAVVYHADSPKRLYKGSYEALFKGLVKNCHAFNIQVIHLTLNGFPGWGDENVLYPGNPENIVYNREKCFTEFLETAPDDVYWFTEPDSRIVKEFPPLTADLALTSRPKDNVKVCPAWRLCTPKAIQFFRDVSEMMEGVAKDWDGDSHAFEKLDYKNYNVEFREYSKYVARGGEYSRNYKGESKDDCP